MAKSDERMERVPAFLRVIEDHIPLFISCSLNVRDLRSATRRIWNPLMNLEWVDAHNPFIISFRVLMDMFHAHFHILELPFLDHPVDLYFDGQSDKRYILDGWDEYLGGRSDNIKHLYGSTPRFVDDEKFLPLQAADLWAWWVRKWAVDRDIGSPGLPKFGQFWR